VSPEVLASVSGLPHPARRIAVFRRDDLPRLDPAAAPEVGLALWHVGDPGNVGTILRSADALGPSFVAFSAGCADPTGPKALRASMGAVFRVPLGRFEEAPGRRVALVARGGESLEEADLDGPVTFVLGAEREGLPESVVRASEGRVSIPLEPGAESLNVAVAAAIALYERRRSQG
jgi:TrmH family RNA methyltransferase